MDVFHFAELGNFKYVHHTIDTFSLFQWATALYSEKPDPVVTHLLGFMAVMGISTQTKSDNAPAHVSTNWNSFSNIITKSMSLVYHTILQDKQ